MDSKESVSTFILGPTTLRALLVDFLTLELSWGTSAMDELGAWGAFVRCLGVTFSIALASLWWQSLGLVGSAGLSPAARYLRAYSRDFGLRALLYFPTAFWLTSSDAAVACIPLLGAVAGAAVASLAAPGAWSPALLGCCHVAFLSMDFGRGAMWYPWDSLLLQTGFLALWLPALDSRGSLSDCPPPLLAFCLRVTLVSLMTGFGRLKFTGADPVRDRQYIRPFLLYQPLPTKAGWLAHVLCPDGLVAVMLKQMQVTECVLPVLLFFPGWPRLVAAASIAVLMVGIGLTGNFGVFQIATITLCVPPLLFQGGSVFDTTWADVQGHPCLTAFLIFYFLPSSLLYWAGNSWISLAWTYWPSLARLEPALLFKHYLAIARGLAPFRAVQGYGIFLAATGPPQRWVPVYETSEDGLVWEAVPWRVFPSSATHGPSTVAPYHPRLDHAIFYEAYGASWHNDAGFVGRPSPYSYSPGGATQWVRLQVALLRGRKQSPALHALMGTSAAARETDPRYVRASLLHLTAPTFRHWWATGEWWHVVSAGLHLPPVGSGEDEGVPASDDAMPCGPEAFAWEAAIWRRRAQQAAAGKCVVSAADYDLLWSFVADVRIAALGARRSAPDASLFTPPVADGAVDVPALVVFDATHVRADRTAASSQGLPSPVRCSASAALPLEQANAAFTFAALPAVVALIHGRGRVAQGRVWSADDLVRVRRTLSALTLPILRGCARLFDRSPPLAAALASEWAADGGGQGGEAYCALGSMIAGTPGGPRTSPPIALNGAPHVVTTYAGNDDAGVEGCMRSYTRFGLYASWLMLVGGREAYEEVAGGRQADVSIPFANDDALRDVVATRSLPATWRALAGRGLSPSGMATEAGYFLSGVANYRHFGAAAGKARLLVSQQRPSGKAEPTTVAPLPGIVDLSPRLAAHPELRLWDPVARAFCPPLALPLWLESPSGGWALTGFHGLPAPR